MKRAGAALVLAAGIAGLILIGRTSGDKAAQAAVRHAAARTVDAGSSRFELTWQTPVRLPAHLGFKPVEGTMDYVHHRGLVSYPRGTEMLYDGDVVYMRWSLPWHPGGVWVRAPLDPSQPDPLDLQDRAMRNPIGLLSFLTGASDDAHAVGREEMGGTATTHYEGTLDLQKVVVQAPLDRRAELQDTLNFIGQDMSTKVPFGLWVDGHGLAHRLRIDQSGGYSVTIDYYDFGVPVVVTPPPAEEVISPEELSSELMQHAGDSNCDEGDAGSGGTSSSGGSLRQFCVRLARVSD